MEKGETNGSKTNLEVAGEALGRGVEAICHPLWFQWSLRCHRPATALTSGQDRALEQPAAECVALRLEMSKPTGQQLPEQREDHTKAGY